MPKRLKRKVPPSRIKYENNHPTVSCRVSKEIYDRLTESKKLDGKSFADILKIGACSGVKRPVFRSKSAGLPEQSRPP